MQIKGFMEWVNETLLNEVEIQPKPTGIKKDFAGNANSSGGAEDFFKMFSVPYKDTDGIERTYVKQVGTAYFANVAFTRRYLQADKKNVMEFTYAIGDQLIPVKEVSAKRGGVSKPATTGEIAAYAKGQTSSVNGATVNTKKANFSFSFGSGEYAIESITPEKRAQLTTDLQPILAELKTPKYTNCKTTITITASTSTSGLRQATLDSLITAGFKPVDKKYFGNDALCAARLATIKKFIISLFTTELRTDEADLLSKVEIKQVAKPSQGAATTFQYISADIEQTGQLMQEDQKLKCDLAVNIAGTRGTFANNYVGYKKDFYITAVPGKSISIKFDPKRIPDMVFLKYGTKEFLSTWLGGTNTLSETNFVNQLNKTPDLEAKINAELAACGSTETVATLRPNAKVNGKWVVYPGVSQGGKPDTFTFPLGEKLFGVDTLLIRCFSPLAGTEFIITANCSPSIVSK